MITLLWHSFLIRVQNSNVHGIHHMKSSFVLSKTKEQLLGRVIEIHTTQVIIKDTVFFFTVSNCNGFFSEKKCSQLEFSCMHVKIKPLQRRHVFSLETTHWKTGKYILCSRLCENSRKIGVVCISTDHCGCIYYLKVTTKQELNTTHLTMSWQEEIQKQLILI